MPRLLFITTDPSALRVLCEGQLAYFKSIGYEVIAVAQPGTDLNFVAQRDAIQAIAVPMQREMRPLADLVSLWRLWRLIRRLRPDIVCTATSKASLLGLMAARAARVPVRVYRLWGLRLETARGLKRRILGLAEWLSAACAHRVLSISNSLRTAFIEGGFSRPDKIFVVGHGSNNGIRAEYFLQSPAAKCDAEKLRADWGISQQAPVIGFVGRLVRDKGIVELVDAFQQVLNSNPDAWLLLVGNYEQGDPVPEEYVRQIDEHPQIIRPGFVELQNLAPYYGAMSVFVFPTHREGFGNVAVEAGAAGLPVVAFRATGAVDAVTEEAGTLVDIGDVHALATAIVRYLNDKSLRSQHGAAGCRRALTLFRPEPIWRALDEHFRELLALNGRTDALRQLAALPDTTQNFADPTTRQLP
jgi:glycosyltransferase involved in cell wall biosynthesis